MRTTIEISDELLRDAKKRAANEGSSLRQIVEAALRNYLAPKSRPTAYKLRWRAEHGRLLPGVDLDDRDSLFEKMDGGK